MHCFLAPFLVRTSKILRKEHPWTVLVLAQMCTTWNDICFSAFRLEPIFTTLTVIIDIVHNCHRYQCVYDTQWLSWSKQSLFPKRHWMYTLTLPIYCQWQSALVFLFDDHRCTEHEWASVSSGFSRAKQVSVLPVCPLGTSTIDAGQPLIMGIANTSIEASVQGGRVYSVFGL